MKTARLFLKLLLLLVLSFSATVSIATDSDPTRPDFLPQPHRWEGALDEHYEAFLQARRAEVRPLFGDDAEAPWDSRGEAIQALEAANEMARLSQSDYAVCLGLETFLAEIHPANVAQIHIAPVRGHASQGLNIIEPRGVSLLLSLYREQAKRCTRILGPANEKSVAARDRAEALLETIRAASVLDYANSTRTIEDSLDPNYEANFLDLLDGDLTEPQGIAVSLMIRARWAVDLGEYQLAEIYAEKSLSRVYALESGDRVTQLIIAQLIELDNVTGRHADLWAPELDTLANSETANELACTRTLYASIESGVSYSDYSEVVDYDLCDQHTSEWSYRHHAQLISQSRYRYFASYDPHLLHELKPTLAVLFADLRKSQDEVQLEFDLRAVMAQSDIGNLTRVAGRYLDALWHAKLENRSTQDDDRAFRLLQLLNDQEADDAMLQNAANSLAAARGMGSLVTELQALNAVDYSDAVLVGGTGPGVDTDEAWDEFFDHSRKLERRQEILTELQTRLPEYFQILNQQALSLIDAQALLGPDEAIFIFAPSELGAHGFVVTADAHEWVFDEAYQASSIDRAATRLLWDVFASVDVPSAVEDYWVAQSGDGYSFSRKVAHQVYRATLASHERLLADKRRLFTLTNTGGLANLPFAMLVTEEPQGVDDSPEDLRNTAWLAERFELARLPTLQTLSSLRNPTLRAANAGAELASRTGLLGIGNPLLEGSAETRGATSRPERRVRSRSAQAVAELPYLQAARRMSRLEGTERELLSISEVFGDENSVLLLGPAATEQAFRNSVRIEASVIAFATHGVMAGELSGLEQAALILTPPPVGASVTQSDDGVLTAAEIAELQLPADWAILSACNTATGEADGAPGLSGLSRAFFFAGVRNVLASLWPVDDNVAPILSVETISTNRQSGKTKGASLQDAMRTVREDRSHDDQLVSYAHPIHWAPFILIGDAGS